MKRPHYAWMVCLGGALVMFSTIGLGVNVFTIYQPEIILANGFSNAQGSWITTTRSLFILGTLLTVNQMCRRLGLRLVMTLGVILLALSCFCFGLANSFFSYCFAAALTGIGYCYGGMVPLSIVIGTWFRDRRSLALGLASAGSGVSTIFAPLIVTRLIQTQGLTGAFMWEGCFILVTALLVWKLIRNSPAELGLEPYHLGGDDAPLPPAKETPRGMKQSYLLLVLLAAFLIGGPGEPDFSHLTVLYTSEGYDPTFVAALMSYAGLAITIGKIICGQTYDRMGSRWGNYYICGVLLAALLLCCLAPVGGTVLPFLAITLIGLGLPVSAVSPTVWGGDLSSDQDYGRSVRSLTAAYTAGVLFFGPLPGILADRMGSYVPSYAFFAVLLVAAALIIQSIYYRLGIGGHPRL